MKYLAAVLFLGSAVAMAAGTTRISGYISDSHCSAMHTSKSPNEACVKKCIQGGSAPVFVDDASNAVWKIDNPDLVKDHYGHHVRVTATVNNTDKSIHITKVAMLPAGGQ
jgi:hypothetical protein